MNMCPCRLLAAGILVGLSMCKQGSGKHKACSLVSHIMLGFIRPVPLQWLCPPSHI